MAAAASSSSGGGLSSSFEAQVRSTSTKPNVGSSSDSVLVTLDEVQEYHSLACRERATFRQERSELSARLKHCEHEFRAEQQIGTDLEHRIATLEAAIRRERLQYEGYLKASPIDGERDGKGRDRQSRRDRKASGTDIQGAAADAASSPPCKASSEATSQILAAYLDRLPQSRETACRPVLLERLRCAGLSAAAVRLEDRSGAGAGVAGTNGGGCPSSERSGSPRQRPSAEDARETPGLPLPTWKRRWTLRSHLDGARSICCDESMDVLISCGEDALVKGWDLQALRRGAPETDELEPYVTFRGHTAAVMALSYRPQDRVLFSAGMDCSIRAWHLPDSGSYNSYGVNMVAKRGSIRLGSLVGHQNCVWSLARHPHLPYLASASADGSIGLWAAEAESLAQETCAMEASLVVNFPPSSSTSGASSEALQQSLDIPSCVSWVCTDATKVLGGYASSRVALFDARRESQVLDLFPTGTSAKGSVQEDNERGVTSACCHRVQQLAVTGHRDNCARLIDLNSGRFIASFTEHADAVTSVSIDASKGNYIATGCHDGCARIFDLRTGRCLQRLQLHESKYDESLHCALLHEKLLATAGADGSVIIALQD